MSNSSDMLSTEVVAADAPPNEGASAGEVVSNAGSAPVAEAATEAPRPSIGRDQLLSERLRRRLLEQQHAFARTVGARLTAYLQAELTVRPVTVQTVSGERFVDRITTPSQVSVWKLAPLTGMGMMEWAGLAALRLVDLLLGGRGQVADPDRGLSEIERALFDQLTQTWMADWCGAWSGEPRMEPVLLGHELDAGYLEWLGRDTWILEFAYELGLGEQTYPVRLGFPLGMLEARIRQLEQEDAAVSSAQMPVETNKGKLIWNPVLSTVPVEVRAVMPFGRVAVRRLATLQVGETLWAEAPVAHQVEVCVGGARKFVATAGRMDNRWALQINHRVEDAEHEQHQ
ncbi:MAG: FliM/FliN family flagellar motor switch protein [Verrucomicrobiae bacterium]|nr:FliM/FliN family flagellar motor switch protein [Verrucomicrobiae bacterium]